MRASGNARDSPGENRSICNPTYIKRSCARPDLARDREVVDFVFPCWDAVPLVTTAMPGHKLKEGQVKNKTLYNKYICHSCSLTVRDAVQPLCGHWLCESCIQNLLKQE